MLCSKIGINSSKYSGHSFRRGGATLAFKLGTDHSMIKFLGDWSSDVYLMYNQMSQEDRRWVAALTGFFLFLRKDNLTCEKAVPLLGRAVFEEK